MQEDHKLHEFFSGLGYFPQRWSRGEPAAALALALAPTATVPVAVAVLPQKHFGHQGYSPWPLLGLLFQYCHLADLGVDASPEGREGQKETQDREQHFDPEKTL